MTSKWLAWRRTAGRPWTGPREPHGSPKRSRSDEWGPLDASGGAGAALIIDVPEALSLRLPDAPDQRLVEKSRYGLLPRIGSAGERPTAETEIYLVDTLGETGLLLALSGVAVMGGGFGHGVGGHNPLEPARLGCPFVSGPHVENWPGYGELAAHGATRLVDDAAELAPFFRQAIEDPSSLTAMAQTARAVVGALDAGSGTIGDRVLGLLGT